ncbi:MAG: hypothetical protein HY294_05365 [Candidatus Rokubacteria bacterium]|nr:hypothetical protein [Candidatus Rokubacteria bacterium]MBI3825406.1 hypothetical protein [Candidatus Rokubacteria bacterium]
MTPIELRAGVCRGAAVAVAALAVAAGAVGGWSALLGVALAGALTILNFWWLTGGALAAGRQSAGLVLSAGLRFTGLLAAFAAVCASGWAHPVALVAGLVVVPCVVIAQGLRAAR